MDNQAKDLNEDIIKDIEDSNSKNVIAVEPTKKEEAKTRKSGRPLEKFAMTARCMNGTEVVGYYIVSSTSPKSIYISKEVAAFLVGQNRVKNVQGALTDKGITLTGVNGFKVSELPTAQMKIENGKVVGIESTKNGKVGLNDRSMLPRVTKIIKKDKAIIGVETVDDKYGTRRLNLIEFETLGLKRQFSNVYIQKYNGRFVPHGINCNWGDIPVEQVQ